MNKVEPINTFPIQTFINQVKSADASRSKEVVMTIEQAKILAFTLGVVMSRLTGDLEKILTNIPTSEKVIEVKVDGGNL